MVSLKELRQYLDALGIKYSKKDKKQQLLDLFPRGRKEKEKPIEMFIPKGKRKVVFKQENREESREVRPSPPKRSKSVGDIPKDSMKVNELKDALKEKGLRPKDLLGKKKTELVEMNQLSPPSLQMYQGKTESAYQKAKREADEDRKKVSSVLKAERTSPSKASSANEAFIAKQKERVEQELSEMKQREQKMKLDDLIKTSESRAVRKEKRVAKIPEKKILKPKEGVKEKKRQAEIKRQAVEDLTSIAEKAKSKFKEEQEFKKLLEAQKKMSIKDKKAIRRKSEVDFKKLLEAQKEMEEKEKQEFEKIRLATEKQRVKEEEKIRRASQELKLKKELEQKNKEKQELEEKEKQELEEKTRIEIAKSKRAKASEKRRIEMEKEREREKERQSMEDEKARNKALNPKEKAKTKGELVTEAILLGIPKKEAEKMKKSPLKEIVKTEYIKALKESEEKEIVPSKLKQRVYESRESKLAKAKEDMRKSREYLRKSNDLQAEEARQYYGLQAEEPPDALALAFTNWDFQGALNGFLDNTPIKEVVDRAKKDGIVIDPAQVARFLPRDMAVALIKQKGIEGLDKGLRDYIIARDGTVPEKINTKLYNQIKGSAPLNVSPALPIRASRVLDTGESL